GSADGVTQGNGAAVDVDLFGIPAQSLADAQCLGGKGFVGLDQIQIGQLPAGLFQAAAGGRDGGIAHDGRVDPGAGVGGNAGQDGQAERCRLAGAHQQHRGGAVVEAGGVAGGDAAVLPERGL